MIENNIEHCRKKLLNDILGTWESDYIINSKNEEYKLILTFNRKFGLNHDHKRIKAIQQFSPIDERECYLSFYWVRCDLQILCDLELKTNMIIKTGMFSKLNKNQLGLYKSNVPFLQENLLLKFNRINIVN